MDALQQPEQTTGTLRDVGVHRLGNATYRYVRCVDCGTEYPDGMCNGRAITLCPWCRTDSRPWTNGRGC